MMVFTRGCTAVSDNLTFCVGVRVGSCHGEVRVNLKLCWVAIWESLPITFWPAIGKSVCTKNIPWSKHSEQLVTWPTPKSVSRQTVETVVSQRPAANCGTLQSWYRVLLELYCCRDTTGWQVSANSRITPPRCLEPHFDPSCLPRFLPDCPLRSWLIGARQEKGAFTSILGWLGTL